MSSAEKLVRMINQIAQNFQALGDDAAVQMTAEHIIKFWSPRMQEQLGDCLAQGETGISDIALSAFHAIQKLNVDAQ